MIDDGYRYIGKSSRRPEGGDKVSGKAVYIHDLDRRGQLFGKIKFSEHASAKIVSIDTSKAERLPGVRAVLTGDNSPELRIGFLKDNFALKRGVVRQFRDEVAAVAAIDPEIAAEAVALIEVEYEELLGVFSPEEAMIEAAPLVHQFDARGKAVKNNLVPLTCSHLSGDMDRGRRQAKFVAEGDYSTPLIQQSCMGTAGCIAELDSNGNLTMWAKTQIPFLAQRDYQRALVAILLCQGSCRLN